MNVNDSISATMDTVKGKEIKDQSVKKKSWNADAQKNQSNKHHLHQGRPLIVRYPGGFLHRK